jgi:TRAP-type mannitol/chloroaromatic compound transport system permease small subunit
VDEILKKLAELEGKIDAVYKSAEKTRKYFLWTIIGSVVLFLLPLVGLIFVIPYFLDALGPQMDLLK